MSLRLMMISLALLGLTACERKQPTTSGPPATPGSEVRVKVNGVPITGFELGLRLSAVGSGQAATPAQQQQALSELVDEELQAQRATQLGYQPEAGPAGGTDARARDSRRHRLAKRFRMTELFEKTVVAPDEARAWFEANTARVQSEFQVQFIKVQGKETGDAVLAALASGRSFDDVAAAHFPRAPEPKPWAVQTFGWAQVPPPWWTALDKLEEGKSTGLIADVQDRFWIVKLVGRKQTAPVAFEAAEPAITASLRARKFEERRDGAMKELRAAAKIEWVGP